MNTDKRRFSGLRSFFNFGFVTGVETTRFIQNESIKVRGFVARPAENNQT